MEESTELKEALSELEESKAALERMRHLEAMCQNSAKKVASLKLDLKKAREEHEARVSQLRSAIRDQNRPMPLFDSKGSSQEETDESWRQTTIEDAGIPEKLCVFLRENKPPIETVGDIADWSDKHKKFLTDVPGIGPAKAKQIDEIIDGSWATLNEQPEDEGDEDAEDDAGEEEDDEE